MVLGLSLAAFTQLHVALSLIGIIAGLIVALSMLSANRPPALTALFLASTALTDITGFLFPMPFDPADVVGIIDLAAVLIALLALYGNHLARAWRWVYVVSAVVSLYLNCFVLVVQTFQKVPFFHQFAPTGKEPAFAAAQGVLLVLFVCLAIAALRRFKPRSTVSVMV
ncbi:MAG TPA: hypothetical protein VGI93_08340 [Steroidobacteraceae bacterium]|jgi:hypothetical protein